MGTVRVNYRFGRPGGREVLIVSKLDMLEEKAGLAPAFLFACSRQLLPAAAKTPR